jgi:HSP20 family protein
MLLYYRHFFRFLALVFVLIIIEKLIKKLFKIIIMTTVKFNQPSLKNLDIFLDNLLNELPVSKNASMNFPAVNILENNDNYELEFNVPGRKKEDFKITVDKDILTVSFEKNEENKDEKKQFIKREFVTQSFKRSFTLDEKINSEGINAKYENGILLVSLPKKEEVKVMPKEISVK